MSDSNYIQKIQKKIYREGSYHIPYNTQYRVKGVYDKVADYVCLSSRGDIKYTQVHASYINNLPSENPFYDVCNRELKPQPAHEIPASFVVEIANGRIYQDIVGTSLAVITQGNQLLGDVSYQYKTSNVGTALHEMSILKQKFFTVPVAYKGVVFSMLSGSVASTNFFHWLYDALPRVYLLKESGLFSKVDYFLVPALKHKYHRESLQLLGIDLNKVIECEDYVHIQAEKLIVTSHIRHQGLIPGWVCNYHQKAFVKPSEKPTSEYPEYIYIRRGDSKIRQVVNEEELIRLLESYGFRSYLLSKLPFEEQVKLFASAKVIVAAHGAGLANLSFCKNGSTLIELFAGDYIKPTYHIISQRKNIHYKYMVCSLTSVGSKTIRQAINSNMYVNMNELEETLRGIKGMRRIYTQVIDKFTPQPIYSYAQLSKKPSLT